MLPNKEESNIAVTTPHIPKNGISIKKSIIFDKGETISII